VASRLYINYFQPSFKLKSKKRDGARVAKVYYPPSTPCERLMASTSIDDATKARLKAECDTLDPMTLLRDIRAAQQVLQEIGVRATAEPDPSLTPVDIQNFLSSLSTAWKSGEVRPTHARKKAASRSWRTRVDPLAEHLPEFEQWLIEDPTLTAKELLERLATTSPNPAISKAQLRTLQRRIKVWRADRAKSLIFCQQADAVTSVTASEQPSTR
jgi:hypothetical protein